jgi:hypothetical protein
MRPSRLELRLDDLNVDSFAPEAGTQSQSVESEIVLTVLYETEQISCGGSCQTCPVCWA